MIAFKKISAAALPITLSFSGGYADASGYLLAASFTGHITGNTVLAAVAVATGRPDRLGIRVLAIVVFGAATFVGAFLVERSRVEGRVFGWVTAVECLLVALAPVEMMMHEPAGATVLVACLCLALGLQNGAFRKIGSLGVHTTYVTGDLTTMLVSLARATSAFGASKSSSNERATVQDVLAIWLSFGLGALAAGVSERAVGAYAVWLLVIPLAVALALSSAKTST